VKILHLAFVEHDALTLLLIAWAVAVLVYVGLQGWFGCAWTGRWRIVALVPLAGVVLTAILTMIVVAFTPDAPPLDAVDVIPAAADGVILFAPFGLIYLLIAGVTHRFRVRSSAL
jgi:hypothetical protein